MARYPLKPVMFNHKYAMILGDTKCVEEYQPGNFAGRVLAGRKTDHQRKHFARNE